MDYINVEDASRLFGRGWSVSSVYRRIDSGELVEGKHYVNSARPNSQRRSIKLLRQAIEKYLLKPAAKR